MSRVAQKEDLGDPDVIERLRAARGQRALPHRAVPADGGRHPRHQPQGVERLEGQAAGRPVPLHAARAGRPRAGPGRRDRGAQARSAGAAARCTPCPSRRTRSCGTRWTSATSCATTPATSPGTRGTCRATWASAASAVVRARLSPVGEGLQVLVYTPDQPDLFARICGYFDQAGFSILDAKIHTASNGYALDTFQVVTSMLPEHYRELISMVESELEQTIERAGPLPAPSRGRVSRRVKSFPVAPRVQPAPDEKAQRWLLTISASDRVGPALLGRARAGAAQDQPAARQGHHAGRARGGHLPDRRRRNCSRTGAQIADRDGAAGGAWPRLARRSVVLGRVQPGNSTSVKPNWVKSRTRIGYSLPIRWSHSCCTTRAWKPSTVRSIGVAVRVEARVADARPARHHAAQARAPTGSLPSPPLPRRRAA